MTVSRRPSAGAWSREERCHAYDHGIQDAIAHWTHGAKLASPWGARSRMTHYWRRGMQRTLAALEAVAGAAP